MNVCKDIISQNYFVLIDREIASLIAVNHFLITSHTSSNFNWQGCAMNIE